MCILEDKIAFEISHSRTSVALTLDWVIWHTVMYHSSTSTYIPNFVQIGKTFCGQTDRRTDIEI